MDLTVAMMMKMFVTHCTNADLLITHCMDHKLELVIHKLDKEVTQASHFQKVTNSCIHLSQAFVTTGSFCSRTQKNVCTKSRGAYLTSTVLIMHFSDSVMGELVPLVRLFQELFDDNALSRRKPNVESSEQR